MEISATQMLVEMINDRRYSASCIAKETEITLANICKILDGYKTNLATAKAIWQLYKSLLKTNRLIGK